MGRLDNKVAIVTGGNAGIGKAIALEFAREGAAVVLAARREEPGLKVVAEIEAADGRARFLRADVSKEDDVIALVDLAVKEYGRLDVLVNNAGLGSREWAAWDAVMNVNLKGAFFGCKYGAAAMEKSGGGSIINVASALALVATGGAGPYVVSKHGLIGLTKEMAIQWARRGVRINALCPGWIETEMIDDLTSVPEISAGILRDTPIGRFGRSEEMAKAALFLASDDSSFVVGASLVADGGWTIR